MKKSIFINMPIAPLQEIYAIPITAIIFGLIIVILNSLLLWLFIVFKNSSTQNF